MRLRLTVQRNGLPAANVLWNVPDTISSQAYTITRLLEDVNQVIPLEAEQWGLEHYVVEVGGFECLHFSPVMQALKEDDHVSIRPLMTAEERARTLTGRHQISEDGRHLVDGIPFGRPYLRNPTRPAVRIPPRKRQRLNEPEVEVDETGLITDISEASSPPGMALLTNGDTIAGSGGSAQARTASRRVRFRGSELEDDEEDEDSDEDDEDFDPDRAQAQVATMDEDDESEDDSDFDSDDTSDSSSASGSSSSESDSDDSSSASDSDSDASSPPEVKSSKGPLETAAKIPLSAPPGLGKLATHSRNSRRTRTNRLRHLKEAGKLPADADLKALAEYEAGQLQEPSEQATAIPFSTYTGKRKRVDSDVAENTVKTSEEDILMLEQRKQDLMARFGPDLSSTPAILEGKQSPPTVLETPSAPAEAADEATLEKKETPKKRLRPDTGAISRILARQAMPSSRKSKKTKSAVEDPAEPEGATEPDFWKSKINLSAFECWEEDFDLSAPPFPFKQHWDPASKLMREKADKKKQKKGGKKKRESQVVEQEEEEEKIYLDYDDTGNTEDPDAQDKAAIDDQLRQDAATAAQSDLPLLPDDMSSLADLIPANIQKGAIIACKFFTVNPVTITPEISGFKTATVDREGDSGNGAGTIRLKLAQRDLPKREKKFDNHGNRLYDAMDQFYMEAGEEDEDVWEGQFGELLEAKLLQAA
ncbi:hypothetical protein DE146DRAFT_662875 [Phaeosphaeria sp. MPI-PUGE-AT-0046c]|nr:hypothetical protein DE146DRAFT_662875 [Phaeosphaeria sp. MPI-PUGE-AT-0046c]